MYTLENDDLRITVAARGAELQGIYHKKNKLQYLWDGDPAFWSKHSPILFPIVGTLKNGAYIFQEKSYPMGRHGFAREKDFESATQTEDAMTLTLKSDESSLALFPFPFRLDLTYTLVDNKLSVAYTVVNTGTGAMYFSIGGHPAFKVPLTEGSQYTDYYLEFGEAEEVGRWPISKDGLIEMTPLPLLKNTAKLPLTRELFYKDAIVLKRLRSHSVQLLSRTSAHGLRMDFPGFPYFGIWAAKGADFVCLEPWCGIADDAESNQQLVEKEGINMLAAGETVRRSWSITLF